MSNRKLAKAVQRLFKQIWKLQRSLSKAFVTWLLRMALLPRRRRSATAGFVLPTTVFLILIVTLTTGALSYRAYSNSTRVIGNVQSKAIYNAATPAIDRARAKIESLFNDGRYPGGVPSEGFLTSMMLNTGDARPIKGQAAQTLPGIAGVTQNNDPYTLLDETRIDVNGGGVDNAWIYHDDSTKSSIVYSVSFSTPDNDPGADGQPGTEDDVPGQLALVGLSDDQKALGSGVAGPYTRNGPLSNNEAVACRVSSGSSIEQDWYQDATDTSKLRKRFQVDAFVVKDDSISAGKPANFTTLEFAQDRLLERGNKWGAWFRNDLEVHPGAGFNWNGAMHSEGNIVIGNNNFKAFLISSRSSCLFLPETNSEISVRQVEEGNTVNFVGAIASGQVRFNSFEGSNPVHTYNGNQENTTNVLNPGNDWANDSKPPIDQSLKPDVVVRTDGYEARGGTPSNTDGRIDKTAIDSNPFATGKRFIIDRAGTRPYLDDTYRADNRYGPKQVYNAKEKVPAGGIGGAIPSTNTILTRNAPPGTADAVDVGLDGYWERRSIAEGMRILVGERLELGNPSGWVAPKDQPTTAPNLSQTGAYPTNNSFTTSNLQPDLQGAAIGTPENNPAAANAATSDNEGDPLNPPYRMNFAPPLAAPSRAHEERQRRALRDNLAAVQATAVYHSGSGNAYPVACLATTAHPGTPYSLRQSIDFRPGYLNTSQPWFDFFYGKGTNGWEFTPPPESALSSGPLRIALQNLATFAGDPDGAFPPKQETGKVHPDPNLTMWGNFSNLRRALTPAYADLSPADKTYLQTAGCTVGMLAYNINQVQQFNPSDLAIQSDLAELAGNYLYPLMDGRVENGEVLPKERLKTYDNNPNGTYDNAQSPTKYDPRDYDNVTPAMFLAALKNKLQTDIGPGVELESDPSYKFYQLALLIHEQFQIRRDRTYGFRPSPAANTWNYNPYLIEPGANIAKEASTGEAKPTLWSSACDPSIFKVSNDPTGNTGADVFQTDGTASNRLALSRLCGTVIPPGAMHDDDGKGDTNFPARGNNSAFPPDVAQFPPNQQKFTPTLAQNPGTPSTEFQALDSTSRDNLRAQVAPEFPSLYYLFPEDPHDHDGDVDGAVDNRQPGYLGQPGTSELDSLQVAFQPWKEPYISSNVPAANKAATAFRVVNTAPVTTPGSDAQGVGANYTTPVPMTKSVAPPRLTAFTYAAFSPFPTGVDKSVDSFGVTPKTATGSWVTPKLNTPGSASPNRLRTGNSSTIAVAFQDKVLFNGREWMPSRVLDIDLDMLRNTPAPGGSGAWLPTSGIVYAFREDATREDAIARPANANNRTEVTNPNTPTDPTTAAGTVSIKPVDFVADPDRRVHGFRLRNGERLRRIAGGVPDDKNIRGLSFFSDDLTYIMGDFNLHQQFGTQNGTQLLEEFTEQLAENYNEADFYGRSAKDQNFSKPKLDEWRPSEVVADSVTILSNTFCDGSVIDTFMTAGSGNGTTIGSTTSTGDSANGVVYTNGALQGAAVYNNSAAGLYAPGCINNGRTSFLNQNRPDGNLPGLSNGATWDWAREVTGDRFSPIKISRNGDPLVVSNSNSSLLLEYGGKYNGGAANLAGDYENVTVAGGGPLQDSRPVQIANPTRVNTIMVSGIVPSRLYQGYGGLHNFPRFLERWNGRDLQFAGSFIQLNFSNYGTAPYDQDAWEPGAASSNSKEVLDYYGAPDRRWGYDVGLQMAPAGPAASRFVQLSTVRNEFYNEPALNDPYMRNLCTVLRNNPPAGVNLGGLTCPG